MRVYAIKLSQLKTYIFIYYYRIKNIPTFQWRIHSGFFKGNLFLFLTIQILSDIMIVYN